MKTTTKAPRTRKPSKKDAERADAIAELRGMLKPGDTIQIIIRRVSASGMSRLMSFHTIHNGEVVSLTYRIATACDYSMKDGYLKANGCGMDMGFSVVYNLGLTLFPKGFVPAEAGQRGRNGTPATEIDTDGGYALLYHYL